MSNKPPSTMPHEVIQADRDAAAPFVDMRERADVENGLADNHRLVQAFAAHRISHSTPATEDYRRGVERRGQEHTITDPDFNDVRVTVGGYVYISQEGAGGESVIVIGQPAALALATAICLTLPSPPGSST